MGAPGGGARPMTTAGSPQRRVAASKAKDRRAEKAKGKAKKGVGRDRLCRDTRRRRRAVYVIERGKRPAEDGRSLLGPAVGAGIALLLAPQSGEATRSRRIKRRPASAGAAEDAGDWSRDGRRSLLERRSAASKQ